MSKYFFTTNRNSAGFQGFKNDPTKDYPVPRIPDVSSSNTPIRQGLYKGQPIKSFKKGGMVHKTGVYRVHKGEMVMPKKTVDTMHKKWMLSDGGAVKYSDHSDS